MGIIEIEWDIGKSKADKIMIWVIRTCLYYSARFVRLFIKNYSIVDKTLRRNASHFKLLKFTVIYILIDVCIGFGIGPLLFIGNPDMLMYVGLITLALFIPYFIFISIFFIYYLLQKIYLIMKSLGLTIKSIRTFK